MPRLVLGHGSRRVAIAAASSAPASNPIRSTTCSWQVLLAGQGQIPARQAAVKAGIPLSVAATTVNKVCLSGLNSIYLADLMIQAGDADVVVAGGMESMTNAPYLLPQGRGGMRYGDQTIYDAITRDGLWCAFESCLMGAGTEKYAASAGLGRTAQDDFAARSHERAAAAIKDGRFEPEIVAVPIPQRQGDPVLVETDEGVRPGTTVETLAALKPAFDKAGNITAGNASQLSDGASVVVMMSKAAVDRFGVAPLGEVVAYGQVAGPDSVSLLQQPSGRSWPRWPRPVRKCATSTFLRSTSVRPRLVSRRWLISGRRRCRELNGGAIALGHPIA